MLRASLNGLGLLSCQNYVRQKCGKQFLGVVLQRFSVDTIFPLKDTSESTLFSVFLGAMSMKSCVFFLHAELELPSCVARLCLGLSQFSSLSLFPPTSSRTIVLTESNLLLL